MRAPSCGARLPLRIAFQGLCAGGNVQIYRLRGGHDGPFWKGTVRFFQHWQQAFGNVPCCPPHPNGPSHLPAQIPWRWLSGSCSPLFSTHSRLGALRTQRITQPIDVHRLSEAFYASALLPSARPSSMASAKVTVASPAFQKGTEDAKSVTWSIFNTLKAAPGFLVRSDVFAIADVPPSDRACAATSCLRPVTCSFE